MNGGTAVDWGPAVAVLAVGLVFGALAVLRLFVISRRAGQKAAGVPLQVRDLAGKRDTLLRQLRELEDTASKRTPEQLARERYALELETAGVLLALDERGASEEAARGAPKGAAARSRRGAPATPYRAGLRGFLWGTGTATALLLLGLFVYQSAKPRNRGGSVTGQVGTGGGAGSPSAAPDAEEARIQAALARNPEDIDRRVELVHVYVARRDWMGVWRETSRILEQSPGNAQALAYQAVVRIGIGQVQTAVEMLDKAVAADPDLIDAYAYLAVGYVRLGRVRDADATIARAAKRFPDRAAELREMLAEQKRESAVTQTSVAPGEGDPHAGVATPAEGSGAPARPRGAGRRVAGTVDIDPSLRSTVAQGAVLFVFARAAGASGGPPVAVKRLPPTFPVAFELSEADSMMGQPFPDPLLIEARLDSDGDPTTRAPTDPKARLDKVKAGRTDVRLILRR
ncbi:MAG: tetratricopeptide repeat protein [Myxococcales bacterium]